MNKTVALIYGGAGREHDVSVDGYAYVKSLLDKRAYTVFSVYIDRDGTWRVPEIPDASIIFLKKTPHGGYLCCDNLDIKIDVAIPLLHGDAGESGEVQGLLECAGIKYIGADVVTGAVCIDKHYTKCVTERLGIPTAKWLSFSEKCDTDKALRLCEEKIGFPMFIKPRRLGSSIGACAANRPEEFEQAFTLAMDVGTNKVIVEELITDKRELECAFYQACGMTIITHPSEILLHGFYGYNEKYSGDTPTSVFANIDDYLAKRIREYSELIAAELKLRHLARIDFFIKGNDILFNEVNTFPGFTPTSMYPRMLEKAGIKPEDALYNFIEDATSDSRSF